MKREILFRGKHIHAASKNEHLDGTWIYGYLCDENYINSPKLEGEFLVDPKTVCEYTGLTDKNGKKIFEGDILKIPEKKNHNVKFEYGQFCVGINCPIAYIRTECEVIGNIFDNPDLIKE